jgi:hypothetical protein
MQLFFSNAKFFLATSEQLGSYLDPRADNHWSFTYLFLAGDAQSAFGRIAEERISAVTATPFLHGASHLL